MRRLAPVVLALSLFAGTAPHAAAQAVRSGFISTPMALGDDNYSPRDYGFDINFYGAHSNATEVCTNGYMILNYYAPSTPNCAYPGALSVDPSTPDLPGLRSFYGSVMAPNFSDFKTTPTAPGGGGTVDIGTGLVGGQLSWAATWNGVLGYSDGFTTPSYFQVVLTSLNANGDFIMEYNYDHMAFGTDGGIGYTVDINGTATFGAIGTTEADGTRISCTFIGGLPTCGSSVISPVVTPEPASLVLMGTGLLGIIGVGYRRRRNSSAL